MNLICSQVYIFQERKIINNQQVINEKKFSLNLYHDKVETSSHHFKIKNVLDVSYKAFSRKYGFLYLHTNQGVFSYLVRSSPQHFMDEFKQLKKG